MEMPSNETASRLAALLDMLTFPIRWLFSSPLIFAGVAGLAALAGGYIFFNVNVDLFGLGAPDFNSLVIDRSFEHIRRGERSWTVIYQYPNDSTFTGTVRHISPIREPLAPLLTHDILVTSGEFADPDKVSTTVSNHHFFWTASSSHPNGKINLLHVVPHGAEIYRQLLEISTGQVVRISGREIQAIEAYDAEQNLLGAWKDTGCNSILVTSVAVEQP